MNQDYDHARVSAAVARLRESKASLIEAARSEGEKYVLDDAPYDAVELIESINKFDFENLTMKKFVALCEGRDLSPDVFFGDDADQGLVADTRLRGFIEGAQAMWDHIGHRV